MIISIHMNLYLNTYFRVRYFAIQQKYLCLEKYVSICYHLLIYLFSKFFFKLDDKILKCKVSFVLEIGTFVEWQSICLHTCLTSRNCHYKKVKKIKNKRIQKLFIQSQSLWGPDKCFILLSLVDHFFFTYMFNF